MTNASHPFGRRRLNIPSTPRTGVAAAMSWIGMTIVPAAAGMGVLRLIR